MLRFDLIIVDTFTGVSANVVAHWALIESATQKSMRIRQNAVLILSVGIACRSGDQTSTDPVGSQPVTGSYALSTINGAAVPVQQTSTVRVDSGFAHLWPSGYYEIYVRRFVYDSQENFIMQNGHWIDSNGSVEFRSALTTIGTASSDGRLALSILVGEQQALVFRRVGDAPAPPIRYFTGDPAPAFSANVTTQGAGNAMTISARLVVTNPDVIGRLITFSSLCPAALLLTADSISLSRVIWADAYQDPPTCAPREVTDTIGPGAQKSYADTRRVGDMRAFGGSLVPTGRYYAWLLSELGPLMPMPNFTARLGWVTITQASP